MNIEIVKEYLDAGFWVVPLSGKIPIGSAKGWQKSRLPEATILSAYPKIAENIGIVCNRESNLICIDVDVKEGRDGYSWYKKHEDDFDGCFIQRTGSGGYHILFKYPKGFNVEIQNSKDKIALGVEVLADARYFVAAPSIHPETKKEYTIEHGLSMVDFYHEATELPSWLIEEIKNTQIVINMPKNTPLDIGYAQEADLQMARSTLNCLRAVAGELGDQKTYTACAIGIDYNIQKDTWWNIIKQWNNTHCSPPWSEKDLLTKFNNAYKYVKSVPGGKTAESIFNDDTDILISSEESTKGTELSKNIPNTTLLPLAPIDFKKPNETSSLLLRQVFFGRLVYLEEDFYYYFLDSNCWEAIGKDKLHSLIRTEIRKRDCNANVKSSDINEIIAAMMSQLQAADSNRHLILNCRLDGHRGDFIRLQNGIINLFKAKEDQVLEAHTPSWFSTTILPFEYNATASCPTWHNFLDSVFDGDESSIKALRYWMAYTLSNINKFQKAMLMVGKSRAGKGVISRVLESLVGFQNTSGASLTSIAGNFGLQPLIGKKICFLHDAHKGHGATADIALERLKSIIGHDALQIDRKNKSMSNIRLGCKVTIVTNEVPNFVDNQNAFLARLLLLRFKKSFYGKEDPNLDENLQNELPGIFNWVAEIVPELHSIRSLPVPHDQEEYKETLERSLNPIMAFISDELELNPLGYVAREDMIEIYTTWCKENGRIPLSTDKLVHKLKDCLDEKIKYTRKRVGGKLFDDSKDNRAFVFQGVRFRVHKEETDIM